jgi:phosphoribosylglycinamide formyltransferase-1
MVDSSLEVKNYGILASGQGSNALSLIVKGLEFGRPPQFVILNRDNSPLIDKAEKLGIKTYFLESTLKGEDLDFEARVLNLCQVHQVDWLFLAGFLKILSGPFIDHFNYVGFSQILNIHPSLLPKYPGLGGYKKAYKNNDPEFGHTIHLVTKGVDEGPILLQKVIPTNLSWSLEDMVTIGKKIENKSYALVLETLLKNGLSWDGKQAQLTWVLDVK